jgi:hypothetical protein
VVIDRVLYGGRNLPPLFAEDDHGRALPPVCDGLAMLARTHETPGFADETVSNLGENKAGNPSPP